MGRMCHTHFSEEECLSYSPVPRLLSDPVLWRSSPLRFLSSATLKCPPQFSVHFESKWCWQKISPITPHIHWENGWKSLTENVQSLLCSASTRTKNDESVFWKISYSLDSIKHVKQHWYTFRDHYNHLKEIPSHCVYPHLSHSSVPTEVKRQKSVPEDLRKVEEDGGSPTDLDIRRPFEEEVRLVFFCCFHISTLVLVHTLSWFQPATTNRIVWLNCDGSNSWRCFC